MAGNKRGFLTSFKHWGNIFSFNIIIIAQMRCESSALSVLSRRLDNGRARKCRIKVDFPSPCKYKLCAQANVVVQHTYRDIYHLSIYDVCNHYCFSLLCLTSILFPLQVLEECFYAVQTKFRLLLLMSNRSKGNVKCKRSKKVKKVTFFGDLPLSK